MNIFWATIFQALAVATLVSENWPGKIAIGKNGPMLYEIYSKT
jgi:hypothetical protein